MKTTDTTSKQVLNINCLLRLLKTPSIYFAIVTLIAIVAFSSCVDRPTTTGRVFAAPRHPIANTSSAYSVFVYNGDIFVAGQQYNQSQNKNVATVWKNGIPQYLATEKDYSSAKSLFVSEGDVHALGYQWTIYETPPGKNNVPTHWKNGVIDIRGMSSQKPPAELEA